MPNVATMTPVSSPHRFIANSVAMSLLSYSKAQPDDFSLEHLPELINRAISLIEKELKTLSIEIITYVEEVPKMRVSASKIQQLLLNLLINAQHAIKEGGVITVSLINDGDRVRIIVADTGAGIPTGNLERIFDPFFSTKGVWGRDETVGTGMGLAICRNISREHGGDLTVESMVGVGSAFTLSLPVHGVVISPGERVAAAPARRAIIFSLDKSIVGVYHPRAGEMKISLQAVDNYLLVKNELNRIADLAICDARFSGKIELARLIDECRRTGVPYVIVHCAGSDHELDDLYRGAAGFFRGLPDLAEIWMCLERAERTDPPVNPDPVSSDDSD